jgi:hypothetical protein
LVSQNQAIAENQEPFLFHFPLVRRGLYLVSLFPGYEWSHFLFSYPWFQCISALLTSTLMMEATGSSKMLASICKTTQCQNQDDHNLHWHATCYVVMTRLPASFCKNEIDWSKWGLHQSKRVFYISTFNWSTLTQYRVIVLLEMLFYMFIISHY